MDYETDYLVIGGGAMGLAFVDTMLKETDARRLKQ
jgi:L-2-hydroxyglutarate oxidase LhgO